VAGSGLVRIADTKFASSWRGDGTARRHGGARHPAGGRAQGLVAPDFSPKTCGGPRPAAGQEETRVFERGARKLGREYRVLHPAGNRVSPTLTLLNRRKGSSSHAHLEQKVVPEIEVAEATRQAAEMRGPSSREPGPARSNVKTPSVPRPDEDLAAVRDGDSLVASRRTFKVGAGQRRRATSKSAGSTASSTRSTSPIGAVGQPGASLREIVPLETRGGRRPHPPAGTIAFIRPEAGTAVVKSRL